LLNVSEVMSRLRARCEVTLVPIAAMVARSDSDAFTLCLTVDPSCNRRLLLRLLRMSSANLVSAMAAGVRCGAS
jgi:hypothetical protein